MATPSVSRALTDHPDLERRRAPGILVSLLLIAVALLALWGWLLLNREQLTAEALQGAEDAATLNARVGSRFGVLIGTILLPLFAALLVFLAFATSWRWQRRATGTRLRRRYAGRFDGNVESARALHERIASGDTAAFLALPPSAERGAVVLDVWSADADRVAYSVVGVLADANSTVFPVVALEGAAYADYERGARGRTDAAASVTPSAPVASAPDSPGAAPALALTAPAARLTRMRSSWTLLLVSALVVAGLAALSLVVFPPGVADRVSLTIAGIVLLVLALILVLRLLLIRRAASRAVGPAGEVLSFTPTGVVIAGDVYVPFEHITGVFAKDDSAVLLRKAARPVLGAGGRLLLSAGLSGIDVAIGVRDGEAARASVRTPSSAGRVHLYARVADGTRPGLVQFAFGATQNTAALTTALEAFRARLGPAVPVRSLTGTFDLAIAVGAFSDPATLVEKTRDLPGV